MFQFERQNEPAYNPNAPVLDTATVLTKDQLDNMTYGAMLSGEDPVEKYRAIRKEYNETGNSQYIANLQQQINNDDDIVRRNLVVTAIEDPNLPNDVKAKAVEEYYTKNTLPTSLREAYAEQIAAMYPKAPSNVGDFAKGFYEKEVASEEVDKRLNDFGKELSGDAWEVFSEAAPWLLPILKLNPYTAAIPVAADMRAGYLANKVAQATQQKDFGTFTDLLNIAFKGEGIASTREYLKNLPPKQKVEAVKRLLDVVGKLPALDYEKYKLVQSFVQAEDYGLLDRALDDSMLLMDGALLAMAGKTVARSVQVAPKSPLGTTTAHNPTAGAKIAGSAIVDTTGELAKAFGETHASIIGSILPKQADELIHGLSVEATPELVKLIKGVDEAGMDAAQIAARNELLYSPELKDTVQSTIYEAIKSAKGMAPHLGKSSITSIEKAGISDDLSFKGSIVFGKSADSAFTSYDDALERAQIYAKENGVEGLLQIVKVGEDGKLVNALPPKPEANFGIFSGRKPGKKDVGIKISPPGEYYIKHDWNHTYNPTDLALWGEDAIKISLPILGKEFDTINKLASWVARGPLGRYFFAGTGMSPTTTKAAAIAIDHPMAMEKDFINKLNTYLAKASPAVRGHVDDLIKQGEDLGKDFNYTEITAAMRAKNVSQKEIDDVINGYFVHRRISHWVYTGSNKLERTKMERAGVQHFKVGDKDIYGVKVEASVAGTDVVWDIATNTIKSLGKTGVEDLYTKGGTLVRLHDPIRQGDNVAQFVAVQKGVPEQGLPEFVLPYIPGWAPRSAQNSYFITRTPNELRINGVKGNPEEYITTHAAANTEKEARRIQKEIQLKDPTGRYEVKRERIEEQNILTDSRLYKQQMINSKHRGEERLYGADNIDPLIGLHRVVKSLYKNLAMDEYLNTYRSNFIRDFGEFTGHTFPTGRSNIGAVPNMSLEKSKKLKEAFVAFDYYESLLMTGRYDQKAWQNLMIAAAAASEPLVGNLAKTIKDIGIAAYPPDVLRRLATHLMISLNPVAQRFIQPSQVLVLPAIDPSLVNPNNFRKLTQQTLGLKWGLNTITSGSSMAQKIDRDLTMALGAKVAGMDVGEYTLRLEELRKTGLVASVDQNTIIEGVFSHADVPLKEKGLAKAARQTSSGLAAIPAAGRKVGFDSGEQDNLIASWLTARKRIMKQQPNLDPASPYFQALAHADGREIAFGMNRAGTFAYQNNILAMPLQFITAPHKALLSMTTSTLFTPAEKARLFGVYVALYGSYGTVAVSAVNAMREEFGDQATPEFWSMVQGGLLNWGANTLINLLFDEKDEHTELNLSQRFSPLGGTLPFSDFLAGLSEEPVAQLFFGPSWSLFNGQNGKIPRVLKDISTMYKTEGITQENFKDYLMKATEFATGGTNFMKARVAYNTGIIVAASGMPVEFQATRAEAIAKMIGVQTAAEAEAWTISQKFRDSKKEYEDAGKYIHQSILRVVREKQASGMDFDDAWNAQVKAFLSMEKDPEMRRAFVQAAQKTNRQMLKDTGQNIQGMLYRDAHSRSLEDNVAITNYLAASPSEQLRSLKDKLNTITGSENF